MTREAWRGKRAFDISVSFLLLLLFFPTILIVAISVRAGSAGPILFRQRRVGMGGREFNILKFRTMQPDA
ncbi:MAG: sugar transferase, partial [Pseudonocardiaceae bacterium]